MVFVSLPYLLVEITIFVNLDSIMYLIKALIDLDLWFIFYSKNVNIIKNINLKRFTLL